MPRELLLIAREKGGGLVVGRKERPAVKIVSPSQAEEERDPLGLFGRRPVDASRRVARAARDEMLVAQNPDRDAVPSETAHDAQRLVVAAEDERAGGSVTGHALPSSRPVLEGTIVTSAVGGAGLLSHDPAGEGTRGEFGARDEAHERSERIRRGRTEEVQAPYR